MWLCIQNPNIMNIMSLLPMCVLSLTKPWLNSVKQLKWYADSFKVGPNVRHIIWYQLVCKPELLMKTKIINLMNFLFVYLRWCLGIMDGQPHILYYILHFIKTYLNLKGNKSCIDQVQSIKWNQNLMDNEE